MNARSTNLVSARAELHGAGFTAPSTQRKSLTCPSMPDARAMAMTQLHHQQWASNSAHAVQLQARAAVMAMHSAPALARPVAREELLQGKFALAQRTDNVVQKAAKPMEEKYWKIDADEQCEYVTPDDNAKMSLIARAMERPEEDWPLLASHPDYARADYAVSIFSEDEDFGIEMVDEEWDVLDPTAPPEGTFIYVYGEDGQIRLNDRSSNFHSEAMAGESVLGAGEITLADNSVTMINDESGHYKPDDVMYGETTARLAELNLNILADARQASHAEQLLAAENEAAEVA